MAGLLCGGLASLMWPGKKSASTNDAETLLHALKSSAGEAQVLEGLLAGSLMVQGQAKAIELKQPAKTAIQTRLSELCPPTPISHTIRP